MILISLVGEQPIPNLLPLWQFTEFSAVQFAATSTTKPQAEALCQFIARDAQLKHLVVHPILPMEAYDLGKARQVLGRATSGWQEKGETVCLNFTGGTKIMSAAALQTAYGAGATLMYVSTERNEVIFYQSGGVETHRVALDVNVSVAQYLEACGLEMRLPNPNATPSPKEGDWLEQKVAQRALDAGIFDDVQRNVHVSRRMPDGAMVKNELDVIVTRNGRMAVCSCKSGRNVDNEALYELAALSSRENLGIYCGKVLTTASDDLSASIFERARSSRIQLVDKRQLDRVDFYLKLATD